MGPRAPNCTRIERAAVASEAAIPIACGGANIGVFAFRVHRPAALADPIVGIFRQVVEKMSLALDRFARDREHGAPTEVIDGLERRDAMSRAANKATLLARNEGEMYQKVCDAATGPGGFLGASVALHDPNSPGFARLAASGELARFCDHARVFADPSVPEGQGIPAEVFGAGEPGFVDDVAGDPRAANWRAPLLAHGVTAGAALPLTKSDRPVGVCSFLLGPDSGRLDDGRIQMTRQIADNHSLGVELFARERRQDDVARMFESLGATNEAIIRARTPAELFELVCAAAVKGGDFTCAMIAMEEAGSAFFRIAAAAGRAAERSKTIIPAKDADLPEGQGVSARAFRTARPCISNDYRDEIESSFFIDVAQREGDRSVAALPLLVQARPVGVLIFKSSERGAFTPELVDLLQRLADNVSFALENFDRAEARRLADEQKERLARMYAALNATNEAIMRAPTREDLFERVCEAAVTGGKFAAASIALAEPGSDFLREVAATGSRAVPRGSVKLAISADYPEGRGMSGTAFRTRQPCISNDYLADERGAAFHDSARARGIKSLAALPLLGRDDAVGVLIFLATEQGAFTPELVELLQRLAENVSFALANFDRADERRLASEQKERLTRMFAALSASNEAIMRAATRSELFHLVCEAAVQVGQFVSTIVALSEPGEDFMRIVARAGPKGEAHRGVRIAASDAYPEGRGVAGTAFRTLQPCIINDYLADPRGAAFHEHARREGNRSSAALPLLAHGEAAGVLVFISSECNAFTPDLVELLLRMANNVSFALENFNRADEKARAEERIQYVATHDGLTDLPNRAMFNQLLRAAIEQARRQDRILAVLFIDIDRFKVINDLLGHDAGDALLVATSNRLRRTLSAGDVVARLGGDEFVVILERASDLKEIEAVARQLLAVVCEPLQLSGLECRTTASIGIAVFPDDGEDEMTLTKNADIAMYRAKEEGKNGFRFFIRQNKTQSVERLVFEARLRQALERNEFSLDYQPKVDATTEQITGVEALLRWTLPDLGPLSPVQFIPLAEETGLIVPVGRWVLKTACAQNMAWRRQGLPPLSMAVNLSPRQFSDENLLRDIDDALAASGMPSELLQLEITESMVMHNVGRAIELLDVIRARGVRLAIDDFGTGYSSMSLMKKFPVDTIKVDRSFVQDLPHDAEDRAIAQAILSMGKALGLTVVAEGVETEEQAAFLRDHGCDEMQGFLFSRPVPAERIPDVLRAARFFPPPLHSLELVADCPPGADEAASRASA